MKALMLYIIKTYSDNAATKMCCRHVQSANAV